MGFADIPISNSYSQLTWSQWDRLPGATVSPFPFFAENLRRKGSRLSIFVRSISARLQPKCSTRAISRSSRIR